MNDQSGSFHLTAAAARHAHISESTLRLWEKLGIVHAERTSTGVRLFRLEDVLAAAQSRARRRQDLSIGVGT